jgi:3-phenylpropionate/cinnamic acid dioxygenase small subunit
MATDPHAAADMEVWFRIQSFLVREAELLDEGRMREWLDLLADDIRYKLPIRVTRERSARAGDDLGYHMNEDKGMLTTRIDRLDTEFAWAEDPPSRTRRYVSNVRVGNADDGKLAVRSNILLYRGRHGETQDQLLAGLREDLLRPRAGGFEIAERVIHLDQTTLATHNLAVFL